MSTSAFLLALAAPAHAADTCANAAYRGGDGAKLPECRAWEQVTPVDKGGNQPYDQAGLYPTADGSRVISRAFGSVAAGGGAPLVAAFSSVRGAEWSTFGLDGPVDFTTNGLGLAPVTVVAYSQDRSKVLVLTRHKLTSEAVEGDSNFYVRDTATGSYSLAASSPGGSVYQALESADAVSQAYGSSPDFQHTTFTVAGPPDGAAPNTVNVYEISAGRFTLVSRDANGDPVNAAALAHTDSGQRLVSDDGRRVTFSGEGGSESSTGLYQHVDGGATVLISHSHRADDIAAGAADQPVATQRINGGAWASPDGTTVTFNSRSVLTDDGPGPFYRWSASGDTLVDLLAGVSVPWSGGTSSFTLRHVSSDGRYVWFTYFEVDSNFNTTSKLAVLDTRLKRVTVKATSTDAGFGGSDPFSGLQTNFSPDGTKLAALTIRPLTGFDQTNPGQDCVPKEGFRGERCREAFVFDATSTSTTPICISCGPAGTHSLGDAALSQSGLGDALTTGGGGAPETHSVTNDGRVFFDTPQPLVDADVNTLSDVYEYTPGRPVQLISSGTGNFPATMGATTPSGDDVFFVTADPLVAQDNDGSLDIYDARVNGGIAAQQVDSSRPADPCPSGNCPGTQQAAPAARTPATSALLPRAAAPRFTVSQVSSAARRSAVSTGRLKVSVAVSAPGSLSARASARLTSRPTTVGRTSVTARKVGRYTLTLKLSGAARRALSRGRKLGVTLSVAYSRAGKPASQSVSLARPARTSRGGAR